MDLRSGRLYPLLVDSLYSRWQATPTSYSCWPLSAGFLFFLFLFLREAFLRAWLTTTFWIRCIRDRHLHLRNCCSVFRTTRARPS